MEASISSEVAIPPATFSLSNIVTSYRSGCRLSAYAHDEPAAPAPTMATRIFFFAPLVAESWFKLVVRVDDEVMMFYSKELLLLKMISTTRNVWVVSKKGSGPLQIRVGFISARSTCSSMPSRFRIVIAHVTRLGSSSQFSP